MNKKVFWNIATMFLLVAVVFTSFNFAIDKCGEDDLEGILVAEKSQVLVAGDEDIPSVWSVPVMTTNGDEDIPGVW